jgi:hydroxymethylbilane synthase
MLAGAQAGSGASSGVVIKTTGDRRTDVSLKDLAQAEGGIDKGVFIKELESALAAGEIDVAVHSLKDLPTELDEAFQLAAVLPRAPVADVLVTRGRGGWDALPDGARVGTSSVRRARQMEWLRPGLKAVDIRGNVPTRLKKLAAGEFDAIMLAEAGLRRLGHDLSEPLSVDGADLHVEVLGETEFLPAAGQGAIGLEIRRGDDFAMEMTKMVNDASTWARVRAEREFLLLLGAGCHTPVGVRSALRCGKLKLEARVFPEAGGDPRHGSVEGDADEPENLAAKLFETLE